MSLTRCRGSLLSVMFLAATAAGAHPLGNFTVSHYAGFTASGDGLQLRYVLDHAEIPAFQERQAADANHDGRISAAEEAAYLRARGAALLRGLSLEMDGHPMAPTLIGQRLAWMPGAGGLRTLRLELEARAPAARPGKGWHSVRYQDHNLPTRAGWKEIVVRSEPGAAIADSTVPAADRSRALAAYPADQISSPPQDLTAQFRFSLTGGGARRASLGVVAGTPTPNTEHRTPNIRDDFFTRLIHRESFPIAFLPVALLIAFGLGCLHALSPGHGKTVVGAYLVGSRGTATHAVLLGLTVTVSHTIGVFALGLIVLYASRWIVPERLYPWLGFASGAAITAIGLGLLASRLKGLGDHQHAPGLFHRHVAVGVRCSVFGVREEQSQDRTPNTEHRTPNTALLLLGISGGIVPCPSALVVLLSAISLHRVGLGLLLILAFSAGLAMVLVLIGLMMVTCGRWVERLPWEGGLVRRLPVASAAVVCVLGVGVAVQSLTSGGAAPRIVLSAATVVPLLFGFVLGMKHALETDHLVAVSTIVTEQASLARSAVVGAFWGLGHTSSLFIAALLVIVLRVRIPERVAQALEFTVALMLIALGLQAVRAWLAHREQGEEATTAAGSAAGPSLSRTGRRPYLVGLVHGMAGSAALMLLVLTTIRSPWMALGYVLLFGFGSVAGMIGMSVLLSFPLRFTARRLGGLVGHVRLAAGLASTCFGLFLTWQIGIVDGLFR
jgi:nickel/cobalt exporter